MKFFRLVIVVLPFVFPVMVRGQESSCRDECKESLEECLKICRKLANQSGGAPEAIKYCNMACQEDYKDCLKDCSEGE